MSSSEVGHLSPTKIPPALKDTNKSEVKFCYRRRIFGLMQIWQQSLSILWAAPAELQVVQGHPSPWAGQDLQGLLVVNPSAWVCIWSIQHLTNARQSPVCGELGHELTGASPAPLPMPSGDGAAAHGQWGWSTAGSPAAPALHGHAGRRRSCPTEGMG